MHSVRVGCNSHFACVTSDICGKEKHVRVSDGERFVWLKALEGAEQLSLPEWAAVALQGQGLQVYGLDQRLERLVGVVFVRLLGENMDDELFMAFRRACKTQLWGLVVEEGALSMVKFLGRYWMVKIERIEAETQCIVGVVVAETEWEVLPFVAIEREEKPKLFPQKRAIPAMLLECIEAFFLGIRKRARFLRSHCILLEGPRRVGKTFILRTIEALWPHIDFTYVCGKDLLVDDRREDVFSQISVSTEPLIVAIDDCEAALSKFSSNENLKSAMGQVMDTLPPNVFLIVVASNSDDLDRRFLRGGRLDRRIFVPVLNGTQRFAVLESILEKESHVLSENDIEDLSLRTPGFYPSDIINLCNEARIQRLMKEGLESPEAFAAAEKASLTMVDFGVALDHIRVNMKPVIGKLIRPVPWDMFGGYDKLKRRLQALCSRWIHLDISSEADRMMIPQGILFLGRSGTGKTLLARCLASEMRLNFISVNSVDLLSKYYGESERNVRDLFHQARLQRPCVLFFDEIDAIGSNRASSSAPDDGGVQQRVLSTVLNEMDGVEERKGVYILAASNRGESLDPALIRPGRLDQILTLSLPDSDERAEILRIHTSSMELSSDIDLRQLALSVKESVTGADLASWCREAGLEALRRDSDALQVELADFQKAAALKGIA